MYAEWEFELCMVSMQLATFATAIAFGDGARNTFDAISLPLRKISVVLVGM